ncbi:hypothetical protein H7X46_12505 [Pseudonocardia sp. C8]|uniref:hypothetical protein n=1 Tax=Pseudonocardia sp. C8 TaxID=2762759 RepID=UPI001642B0FB|nr:hypothetical protein [Pseudonocardia sp. C8]MBC3191884.1 hypothetical protein [Pseudonocardia sp. C8]
MSRTAASVMPSVSAATTARTSFEICFRTAAPVPSDDPFRSSESRTAFFTFERICSADFPDSTGFRSVSDFRVAESPADSAGTGLRTVSWPEPLPELCACDPPRFSDRDSSAFRDTDDPDSDFRVRSSRSEPSGRFWPARADTVRGVPESALFDEPVSESPVGSPPRSPSEFPSDFPERAERSGFGASERSDLSSDLASPDFPFDSADFSREAPPDFSGFRSEAFEADFSPDCFCAVDLPSVFFPSDFLPSDLLSSDGSLPSDDFFPSDFLFPSDFPDFVSDPFDSFSSAIVRTSADDSPTGAGPAPAHQTSTEPPSTRHSVTAARSTMGSAVPRHRLPIVAVAAIRDHSVRAGERGGRTGVRPHLTPRGTRECRGRVRWPAAVDVTQGLCRAAGRYGRHARALQVADGVRGSSAHPFRLPGEGRYRS